MLFSKNNKERVGSRGYNFKIILDKNLTLEEVIKAKEKFEEIVYGRPSETLHVYKGYELSFSYGDSTFEEKHLTDDEVEFLIKRIWDEAHLRCRVIYYDNFQTIKEWR